MQLPRYELLLKIATGGMATVYVARSLELDRLVAVKRAHPHLLEDPTARAGLLEEARLASRIRHANVTSVYDVEDSGEDLLLVMDYVEGASLAELLEVARAANMSVSPAVSVRIVLDVALGLAAVHELRGDDGQSLGMVHRDVSPQNVLVGLDGTSRVADFGLARLSSARDASQTTGTLEGKLAYLAPELLEGKRCTPKSELFALGIVLWEALTGKRLFRGENDADTLRRILRTEVPPVSSLAPSLGSCLDSLVARALARAHAERPGSVREFAGELEAVARQNGLIATSSEVTATVEAFAGARLTQRRTLLAGILSKSRGRSSQSRQPQRGSRSDAPHGLPLDEDTDTAVELPNERPRVERTNTTVEQPNARALEEDTDTAVELPRGWPATDARHVVAAAPVANEKRAVGRFAGIDDETTVDIPKSSEPSVSHDSPSIAWRRATDRFLVGVSLARARALSVIGATVGIALGVAIGVAVTKSNGNASGATAETVTQVATAMPPTDAAPEPDDKGDPVPAASLTEAAPDRTASASLASLEPAAPATSEAATSEAATSETATQPRRAPPARRPPPPASVRPSKPPPNPYRR